jgi:glycosyltransferase involved in cell wall biosynthesis
MKVLFLTQGTEVMPASRFRVFQYLKYISANHFEFVVLPAVSSRIYFKFIYNSCRINKVIWFASLLFGRIKAIFQVHKYDVVYIQRETWPLFYPFVEVLISKRAKKIIFDMDDAIFNYQRKYNRIFRLFMPNDYLKYIFRKSSSVIVGNQFLYNYVSKFISNIYLIPTCIDLDEYSISSVNYDTKQTIIGWIGSPSTSIYLDVVKPVLKKLAAKRKFIFRVVGLKNYFIDGVEVQAKEWTKETEIKEVMSFTIGLMPLPDNAWTQGKSGTKILQYMAAGVPAIASPIGANCEMIQNGFNGFLASNEDEWFEKISLLLDDKYLYDKFSKAGRNSIVKKYTIDGWLGKWIDIISKDNY